MSIEKIPVTIITGFLGAGKTTLVRHLMQNPQGRRLAILVNEFGDLGIDGDILKGCADANCPEDAIVELTNGCLCCTVADDFVPTIAALLARPQPPDHILIETSGLALPKPLLKAFEWPDLRSRITVDGVIGTKTRMSLNTTLDERIEQIVVNPGRNLGRGHFFFVRVAPPRPRRPEALIWSHSHSGPWAIISAVPFQMPRFIAASSLKSCRP